MRKEGGANQKPELKPHASSRGEPVHTEDASASGLGFCTILPMSRMKLLSARDKWVWGDEDCFSLDEASRHGGGIGQSIPTVVVALPSGHIPLGNESASNQSERWGHYATRILSHTPLHFRLRPPPRKIGASSPSSVRWRRLDDVSLCIAAIYYTVPQYTTTTVLGPRWC